MDFARLNGMSRVSDWFHGMSRVADWSPVFNVMLNGMSRVADWSPDFW